MTNEGANGPCCEKTADTLDDLVIQSDERRLHLMSHLKDQRIHATKTGDNCEFARTDGPGPHKIQEVNGGDLEELSLNGFSKLA